MNEPLYIYYNGQRLVSVPIISWHELKRMFNVYENFDDFDEPQQDDGEYWL